MRERSKAAQVGSQEASDQTANQEASDQTANIKMAYMVPIGLRQAMMARISHDPCYGTRAKSRWVREALAEFLEQSVDTLVPVEPDQTLTQHEVVYLTKTGRQQLEEIAAAIRLRFPLLEGPRSTLIRMAIRRRLDLEL